MDYKEKLLQSVVKEDDILSDEKFDLAKRISILQRHIIYIDYAVPFLKLKYDEEIAQEVRDLGYIIPSFTDPGYQKALEASESLDQDRVNNLQRLMDEFNKIKN